MDESRNGRITRNLILRVFLVYFLVPHFMLGWLLWPFLSTIVIAATVTGVFNPRYQILNRKLPSVLASLVTCGIIFLLLFIPIVSLVGILGIIFGPLVVTGFLTLMDIYHASYQNLVEPSKTWYKGQLSRFSPLGRLSGYKTLNRSTKPIGSTD